MRVDPFLPTVVRKTFDEEERSWRHRKEREAHEKTHGRT